VNQQDIVMAVADVVQDHIKLTLAPVLSDVKTLQAQVSGWEARWNDLGALRERVAVMEAKSVVQVPIPVEPTPVNMSPVLERVAACEARLSTLGDLRDRVVTVEAKSAIPAPEFKLDHETTIVDLRERLRTVEGRLDVAAVGSMRYDDMSKNVARISERVAVVETRPPVPGPKGDPGEPGKDGQDGAPGLAGLSYEGVYQDGKSYDVGNLVTWGGSMWHANESTTTKPGEGSKAWTLTVKRGRDGKDGRDAVDPVPVVSVGRR